MWVFAVCSHLQQHRGKFGLGCGACWGVESLCGQVLPEWRGQICDSDGRWADGGGAWRDRVRCFLRRKQAEGEQERQSKKSKTLLSTELANWHSLLAMDNSLRASFGLDLMRFAPSKRVGMLPLGAQRAWVSLEKLPTHIREASGERTRRSFVVIEDQPPKLEAAWSGPRMLLHVAMDEGPVGWPIRAWALHALGLRGSRPFDVAHRRCNNTDLAIEHAKLSNIRAECLCLLNTNSGPWGQHANYGRWKAAAEEYCKNAGPSDELYEALFPWCYHSLVAGRLGHSMFDQDSLALVWRHVSLPLAADERSFSSTAGSASGRREGSSAECGGATCCCRFSSKWCAVCMTRYTTSCCCKASWTTLLGTKQRRPWAPPSVVARDPTLPDKFDDLKRGYNH